MNVEAQVIIATEDPDPGLVLHIDIAIEDLEADQEAETGNIRGMMEEKEIGAETEAETGARMEAGIEARARKDVEADLPGLLLKGTISIEQLEEEVPKGYLMRSKELPINPKIHLLH